MDAIQTIAMKADPNVLVACTTIILATIIYFIFGAAPSGSGKDASSEEKAYAVMLGMATGNPKYCVSQKEACDVALAAPGCANLRQSIPNIYLNTRISTRYMAIPDFTPLQKPADEENFFPDNKFALNVQTRQAKYKEVAVPLVCDVARRAIEQAGCDIDDIGKLVVVSSTGFLGPSLDCELIKGLKLSRGTDRTLIGFMGCAAAMNGYRVAMDYVKAHPGKNALMVCIEISSVHTTFKSDMNDAILHAIFADGCAACVLGNRTPSQVPVGTLAIIDDHGHLMEGTEDGITLAINEDGITCTLSKFLPSYIAKNMGGFVDAFLAKHDIKRTDCYGDDFFWAIHPGGRRIIDEAQNGLNLRESQAADSWAVLNKYGNMLSPSVMFVLDRVFQRQQQWIANGETKKCYKMGLAFSFSPGVGAEGIMLKNIRPTA